MVVGAVVVLVVALTGVGLSGGLAAAPERKPPRKAVGTPIDTDRYDLTVHRAWHASKDPTTDPTYADRGRFVVLEVGVKATAKETVDASSELQRALRLRWPDGHLLAGDNAKTSDQRIGSVLAGDGTPAQVHPGLPRRVRAAYRLPAGTSAPKRLEVEVLRWKRAPGFVDQSESWRVVGGKGAVGRVNVDVDADVADAR